MSLRDNPIFQAVKRHADCMLKYGRDPSEENPSPLFAAVVDALDKKAKTHQLVPPPGVRIGDFSWAGNNLMHEIAFLETLTALTQLTGERRYEDAVDEVFAFYPHHCPYPGTGLFPWGEHAQWSFHSRRVLPNCVYHDPFQFLETNGIIHEHLRFAPAWFWERMWRASPECVVRFAKGLDRHLLNYDTFEHNRHAPLTEYAWNEIPYTGQGKDFARHAGMFIFDCAFAFKRSGDRTLWDWARRKLGYHLERRLPNGIVSGCIRTPNETQEGQHDSLACSVFDAAKVLGEDTAEGREFLDTARELFDARAKQRAENPPVKATDDDLPNAWNTGYGAVSSPAFGTVLNHQVYERSGVQWYADTIVAAAEWQLNVAPPPEDRPVVTWAFYNNLMVPMAAYTLTGEQKYLDRADTVAKWAIERATCDGLFLGVINMEYYFNINITWSASGCFGKKSDRPGYYFSGTGAPSLVRNLLRLALLEEGKDDILGVDDHPR